MIQEDGAQSSNLEDEYADLDLSISISENYREKAAENIDSLKELTKKGTDSIQDNAGGTSHFELAYKFLSAERNDGWTLSEILFENNEEAEEIYLTLSNAESTDLNKEVQGVEYFQNGGRKGIDPNTVKKAYQDLANAIDFKIEKLADELKNSRDYSG